MSKIEIKGWPAIIAFALITWPFWLVYGIIRAVVWVILGVLIYGILYPIEKLYNYIKRKHYESLSNRSRN